MKRILIIEDDKNIAELERDYLEADSFEVKITDNGESGLREALGGTYDLILLDLMLPKTDGFTVCRRIRENKDTPVLMVSARRDDIDKIRGLGLGADDYLVKPFSPSELVARVKAHIARYERLTSMKGVPRRRVISVDGLEIDADARRVYLDHAELNFANKEFDLLLFLAENPNIVFSKDTLFDRIWGLDSMADTTTVTVHINRIREKIEKNTANPQFIETVWGAGYRFRACR
jgi:Response regulators consisting of a CheY-like receiver domain and a winged-helix DNA-binding domain